MLARTNILDDEQIASFFALEEVQAAKRQIDARTSGSVYFTVDCTDTIKTVLQDSFGLALPTITVPMRWIKGDIAPHVDVGKADFDTTHLLYLTDSPGQLVVDGASYPITKGSAYSFPEASRHKTIDTGAEPRLLLGPMSEEGFAVGIGTSIDGSGGTTAYFRQNGANYQFSDDQITWYTINSLSGFPIYVGNTDTTGGIFTLEFVSDISFNSSVDYFICDSSGIQFGSTSLDASGSRPVITIDGVTDYPGLIQNGLSDASGYNGIGVLNLFVDVSNGSTLATNGGWIGQAYFGKGAEENYIVNCSSTGPISENGGGIVGSDAGLGGELIITGCSSAGLIGTAAGGIGGRSASVFCQSCWSTGDIDVSGGGIVGSGVTNALIFSCYSTGDISGGAGGICGSECANVGEGGIGIIGCYSEGDVGPNAGGIAGANAGDVDVENSYSLGNMATPASGGIFGATTSNLYSLTNCYTVGDVSNNLGYFVGDSGELIANCYSEAQSGEAGFWDPDHADTVLFNEGLPFPLWVNFNNRSEPYELNLMGYTPYTTDNINLSSGLYTLLQTEFGSSVTAGSNTAAAIVPYKNYTIVQEPGNDIPLSITIDVSSGVISTTTETPLGEYTILIRNDGSYNYSSYYLTVLEAGGTYIDGSGGTSVYIRQSEGDNEYSYNQVDWNIYTSPPIFRNTDTTTGMFTVEFDSDLTFTSNNDYFICETSHIQFGSTSLDASGSRPVITINDVLDYPGLIQNGTVDISGQSNIHVFNLLVDVSNGSTLVGDGGWLGQEYFGRDASDNYVINCSSTGPISEESGGIVGRRAGSGAGARLSIIGCSSSGDSDDNAGGIVGRYAGDLSGEIYCESCWSTGMMGTEAGGITGEDTRNATIRNCYSTGAINTDGGGICGQDCENSTITGCYSTGVIGVNGGGIVGEGSQNVTVSNCYSLGRMIDPTSGGIMGPVYDNSSNVIYNCYTVGDVSDGLGYIIGASGEIPPNCFSEALSGEPGTWRSANADTVLDISVESDTWISFLGTDEPYELLYMGYSPYTRVNIDLSEEIRDFPFLTKGFTSSVTPGDNTDPAIAPNKNYTILDIFSENDPSSITLDASSGVISTTTATPPGEYAILVRNTGSYNISVYLLTVLGGGGSYSCCDRPTFALGPNTGYAEYTDLRVGNILMESLPRKNLSYDQLMTIRKAQSSKK